MKSGASCIFDQASGSSAVLVGVDLGAVTTSIAFTVVAESGAYEQVSTVCVRHDGDPLAPFFQVYDRFGKIAAIAATGVHSHRLGVPVAAGVPEEAALEWAARECDRDGPLTVVNIGGTGFSVLVRDADGRCRYEKNDRCSAGTGQSMERLCARFGVSLDEAAALADESPHALPLTARCAVFAKSELTHYANQGEPHGRLFAGYFAMVAQTVAALAGRMGGDGPVILAGNGARVSPLARALAEIFDRPVAVAADPGAFAARGVLASLLAERRMRDGHEGAVGEDAGGQGLGRRASESTGGQASAGLAGEEAGGRALGRCAGEQDWPADPRELVVPQPPRTGRLTPAGQGPGRVITIGQPRPDGTKAGGSATSAGGRRLVLGIDLGSTGSKAALLDAGDGQVLRDAYRRTDGNPVEAARELLAQLAVSAGETDDGSALLDGVVAVGLTGSGREAAAAVFRAALPEAGERLLVRNEIVAHAAAAAHYDPDGGRSLSIVEIGGQDSKFINVRDGRVVESDMNRVCSAGTGSFLEEQALHLGLEDITGFGEVAAQSTEPLDLGQTCTVFVGDVIVEAMAGGATREDVFAGLQYSVIRNYRNRVMGRRRFLGKIFFQGKPASNPSLARTLAAVTGREVVVPENPGAMGAIGIALLARQTLVTAAGTGDGAPDALDLERVRQSRVVTRREFRCAERECGNLCRIESAEIDVGGEVRRIRSGGSCPRYEGGSQAMPKLPREAPRPFRERAELLDEVMQRCSANSRHLCGSDGETAAQPESGVGKTAHLRVGLPFAHYVIDYLPFLAAFVAELGHEPVVLHGDQESLARGDRRCAAAGACTPVKLLHGLDATGVDVVLAPKFVHARYRNAGAGSDTCPLAQGAPEMLGETPGQWEEAWSAARQNRARSPVLRPVMLTLPGEDLGDDATGATMIRVARALQGAGGTSTGASSRGPREAAGRAWRIAVSEQLRFERRLRAIGDGALEYARASGYPAVLVAGETHVIHEPLLNAGIDELCAANGALAVPVDCYAVPADVPSLPRVHWASAGQCLRAAIAAMQDGEVFPLLLSAYGCGPASFLEPFFDDVLEEYPHAIFETDGLGGRAGYVTRVQAFLHAVADYRAAGFGGRTPAEGRLARLTDPPAHSLTGHGHGSTILFGTVGGTLGRHVAAAMRGRGLAAHFTGCTDSAGLRAAQEGCSGKECLPYQLVWGSLSRYLEDPANTDWPENDEVTFLSVGNGFRSCRANMFPLAVRAGLDRMGLGDRIKVGDLSLLTSDLRVMPAAWTAIVAYDMLQAMCAYSMAAETSRGDAEALFAAHSDRLAAELERRTHGDGIHGTLADAFDVVGRVERVLRAAAAAYADMPQRAGLNELRTVLLCGDIFLRVDEWGNDSLQRRLADLGLRVLSEPFGEFFELLAHNDLRENPALSTLAHKRRAALAVMRLVVRRLEKAVRASQPWFRWQDIAAIADSSSELFDGFPFGETIPTVGGALLAWKTLPVDGIVAVGPRGCAPTLLAEAQLRRRTDIPSLFVYNDGDPIDRERLAGFAWKLRNAPRRAAGD